MLYLNKNLSNFSLNYFINHCRHLKDIIGSSDSKESACNAGDPGLISGSGRSYEEGNGLPIPVFLPIEFHGPEKPGRPTGHGIAELDTTEQLTHRHFNGILNIFKYFSV